MTSFESIQQAQQGNVEIRNQIILENIQMVKKIANSTQRDRFEDAVQDGIFGIIRAIKSYDVMKGAFSTHMYYWIRRAMQERTGYREDATLDGCLANSESDEESRNIKYQERVLENLRDEAENMLWLHEAIDKLDAREKLIIDLIYFHDATLMQCAEVLSVSKVTINTIHQKALKKLKNIVE